jgi:DNA-directed RNA polymerase alpha subunit
MRCEQCSKFVSFDEPQAEVENEDFEAEIADGKLIIKVSTGVRLTLVCAECGSELKETTFDIEMETEHVCDKLPKETPADGIDEEGSIEVEANDRYISTNSKGKPISARYQKHMYGVHVVVSCTCPYCSAPITFEQSDEIQASGMDEL